MNLSVKDKGAGACVSNFTLFGDCRKAEDPGLIGAEPAIAERLYEKVVELNRAEGINVQKGILPLYGRYGFNDGR